jgi:ribosome biogenesis GTPase
MTAPTLETLGWTSAWAEAFAPHRDAGLVPARVTLEHNHIFRVLAGDGEHLAEAAGRLKHRAEGRAELPVVGDWVAVRPGDAGSRAQIMAVLPRHGVFSRKAAGRETEEQMVAANVDCVLIVFGLDVPVKTRAIERYLVVARRSGASPVVVLNKSDVSEDVAADVTEATVVAGDVPVLAVSTHSGAGFEQLTNVMAFGQTVALLGPSGVGKSTIVNRLIGRELLPTGEVRTWDQRGRHTTVHRQLVVRAEGGLIIDTPGMRELQLWDTDAVTETFADIAAFAESCRFRDCRHDREPGCGVKEAVARGDLDAARYEGFLKLQAEQASVEAKRDERALIEAKRVGKIGAKAYRSLVKNRERQGR